MDRPVGSDRAPGATERVSLISVARIVRAHGLEGEVRTEAMTDDPARLAELADCWLVPPPAGERRRIERVRFQGRVPVLKLEGIDTRSDAEAHVGRLVTIPRERARSLPSDRFYPFDLLGCRVESSEGEMLGVVADVESGAGHDWWVVRAGDRTWWLPAVAALVAAVDLPGRRVVVRPPEGLLDLAEA